MGAPRSRRSPRLGLDGGAGVRRGRFDACGRIRDEQRLQVTHLQPFRIPAQGAQRVDPEGARLELGPEAACVVFMSRPVPVGVPLHG